MLESAGPIRCEDLYPLKGTCQEKVLFAFYNFPAEHWIHIRTTNPIESTFATVRLRTEKTKGCGTRLATLVVVFKLWKRKRRGRSSKATG
jgi:transposase-like protein